MKYKEVARQTNLFGSMSRGKPGRADDQDMMPAGGAGGAALDGGQPEPDAMSSLFSNFTDSASPAQVQMRADIGGEDHGEGVRDTARSGMQGTGGQLPYLDAIQESFGGHDVRGVQSYTDGAAANANAKLGAQGFAAGSKVAFAGQPDLSTAAHEAAHVVQQRQGVHLSQGVGSTGDKYEQQADEVADRVVKGRSAEDLLSSTGDDKHATDGESDQGSEPVQMKKEEFATGKKAFQSMWDAHPHNHQEDEGENTSSEDVNEEHGLPSYFENTCAIRLSIMLNNTGHKITPQKTKAAGLKRPPHYSKKTKQSYILGASEMWTYLQKNFRSADISFPKNGRFKNTEEFDETFSSQIQPLVAGKQGIVAFDKIFTYGGSGHVDLFNGATLSDSDTWYPSQKIHIWYISDV